MARYYTEKDRQNDIDYILEERAGNIFHNRYMFWWNSLPYLLLYVIPVGIAVFLLSVFNLLDNKVACILFIFFAMIASTCSIRFLVRNKLMEKYRNVIYSAISVIMALGFIYISIKLIFS